MRRVDAPRQRDDGLTLIEVLVAITVVAIIMAPLTALFVVFLRNTQQTEDRMVVSHDAQIAAAWFTRDVQNIGVRDWSRAAGADVPAVVSIELDAPATGGLYPCGPPGTPDAVVRFAWDYPGGRGSARLRVSYVERVVGTERQLRRLACDADGTVTSELVVAHHLAGTPAVTCRETPCTAAPPPAVVQLELRLLGPPGGEPYIVTVEAQRRQTL